MNVVYVVTSLGAGGTERSLAELLPRLREGGVRPTVVCLDAADEGVEGIVREKGIEVRVIGGRRRSLRQIRRVRRIVKRLRPDVVHTMLFDADVVGRLAAVGLNTTVVTSIVNTPGDVSRRRDPAVPRWRLRAALALEGWTARRLTSHFHAVSEAVADDMVATLGVHRDRITVVERGRDTERLGRTSTARRHAARHALGVEETTPMVVALGRREFQKGFDVLVDAVAALRARVPDLRLFIAGRDGAASDALRQQVTTLGLERHVTFLGWRDDAPDVLAAADAFALPSRYEGLPGALLEAMALEVPAVASDIGAVRAVATDRRTALLVPRDDPHRLADALHTVLTDRALADSLARNGRAAFDARFTIESSADGMLAFYRALVDRSQSG